MSFRKFIIEGLGRLIPDKLWIQLKYFQWFKKFPDLKNPKTFNEKLQWLKLYDHNPDHIKMVDKYEAKLILAEIIGEEYIIPTYGVWNSFDEIDFDSLPDSFVLKTTHDCGGIVICKDKATFDKDAARKFLNKHLSTNYYLAYREWPYKHVKPRILAEAFMVDHETEELRDYKFFCFNGEVKAMYVASDRQKKGEEVKFDFFDENYNHLPVKQGHPNSEVPPKKPKCFEEMKVLASKLSQGIPHLRVDFYEVNGRIYCGELTFFHMSGLVPFEPEEWDKIFGDLIILPEKK